jgi:hypothetical protein
LDFNVTNPYYLSLLVDGNLPREKEDLFGIRQHTVGIGGHRISDAFGGYDCD